MRSCEATGSTISEITCNFITMKNPAPKFLGFFLFLCAMPNTTTYFWDLLSAFSHPWFTPGVTHVKLDVHQCRHWKLAAWQCPAASPQWRKGGTDRSPKGVKLIVGEFTNNGAIKMEKNKDLCSKTFCNVLHIFRNYDPTWLIIHEIIHDSFFGMGWGCGQAVSWRQRTTK